VEWGTGGDGRGFPELSRKQIEIGGSRRVGRPTTGEHEKGLFFETFPCLI